MHVINYIVHELAKVEVYGLVLPLKGVASEHIVHICICPPCQPVFQSGGVADS